ncbi:MAG: hypothetical protein HY242_05120 [Afipia sp.]|nr:hypothetical protein [Afipia sp.]
MKKLSAKKFVYQIFYDEMSRGMLDPGFIPLDNVPNKRPDWFELWVIRKFLMENRLEPDAWYGFLSPKFRQKTSFGSEFVLAAIDRIDTRADVALFSPGANVLAYFQNPFEQGELRHPGLLTASQRFLNSIGFDCNLQMLVTHSKNSAFCNYVIAKPEYWSQWLDLANRFFEYTENGSDPNLLKLTPHENSTTPMKAFVQERLATLILVQGEFKIFSLEPSQQHVHDDSEIRRSLIACDVLKERYSSTGDDEFLALYRKIRSKIEPQ